MLQRRRVLGVAVLVCAFASLALADQPNMRAARTNLQQARAQLQTATNNKAGHRVKAIEHVNKAIGYINNGMAYDRHNNHAQSFASSLFAGAVVPDQVRDAGVVHHHLDRSDATSVDLREQALRHDPAKDSGDHRADERLLAPGEELDHAADRLRGVDRVHRREHEMA